LKKPPSLRPTNNPISKLIMSFSNNPLTLNLIRFCTALRFLTVVPVSWRAQDDSRYFNSCLAFFPIIGLIIGCLGYVAVYLLQIILPLQVVAVIAIIYLAFISGCLHLDGLSDSADGLFSARSKERSLEIMKDSRAGAMGVVVVVCVLLAKYAALSAMSCEKLCLVVFLMPLVGRCAIIFTMAHQKYARKEGGLGLLFYSASSKTAAIWAFLLLLLLLSVLTPSYVISILISVLVTNYLFAKWCTSRIGGATGDTLGAICELTEMVTAITFTASFTTF